MGKDQPEGPESGWREPFFKLWENEEKLTGQNTPPAVRKTKGLRNSRKATPSHTENRPRLLSKDFLRPDRRRALGPRREKEHRASGEGAKPLAALAAHRGEKKRAAPGREAAKTAGQNTASAPHTR